jgi:hypothetical protein
VYRITTVALCLLLLMAAAGLGAPAAHPLQPPQPTYTLRLIVDGLVTFVPSDRTEHPKEMWVLVGNATDPSKLTVGKNIPPHQNHLLIQKDAKTSGRPLGSPTPMPPLGDLWKHVTLENEDLELIATTTTTSLTVIREPISQQPCRPGVDAGCTQRKVQSFNWTVDAGKALTMIPEGTSSDKQLKTCLVTPSYSCPGAYPLLSARFKLARGNVFVNKFYTKGEDNPAVELFNFGSNFPAFKERAQAREVAVDLTVKGRVELRSRPMEGAGPAKDSIFIEGKPNQIVEVRLGNHPSCRSRQECMDQGYSPTDFSFYFNLVNNPIFVDISKLPIPQPFTPNPGFNGQCSPASYTSSGN